MDGYHTFNRSIYNLSIGDTSASKVECHKQNSVIMRGGVHSIYRFASSHRMLITFSSSSSSSYRSFYSLHIEGREGREEENKEGI